jgi:magnesium-transporting ATPase (P-type)
LRSNILPFNIDNLELDRFVLVIAILAVCCGIVFIAIGFGKLGVSDGGGVTRIILLALGIVIGSVPEGLLPTLAVCE